MLTSHSLLCRGLLFNILMEILNLQLGGLPILKMQIPKAVQLPWIHRHGIQVPKSPRRSGQS